MIPLLAQLKDIYFAEKQIYKTLPKMAKATRLPELKETFTAHREHAHGHIERLEEVSEMMGKRSETKPCEAIRGIISEGRRLWNTCADRDEGRVAVRFAIILKRSSDCPERSEK